MEKETERNPSAQEPSQLKGNGIRFLGICYLIWHWKFQSRLKKKILLVPEKERSKVKSNTVKEIAHLRSEREKPTNKLLSLVLVKPVTVLCTLGGSKRGFRGQLPWMHSSHDHWPSVGIIEN